MVLKKGGRLVLSLDLGPVGVLEEHGSIAAFSLVVFCCCMLCVY
jgi:hypothetical protein